MKMNGKLPAYFRDYLDERFDNVELKIKEVRSDVLFLKVEGKKNQECISSVKVLLERNNNQVKQISHKLRNIILILGATIFVLLVHFIETDYFHESSLTRLFTTIFAGL
jgi:hypothetical protein